MQLLELWPMAGTCATSGTKLAKLAKFHAPHGNFKIKQYLRNRCSQSEIKLSFDPPGVERENMSNLWHCGQFPKYFMPKYGNFENRPVSRKPLSKYKFNLDPQWGRKSLCPTSLTFTSGQVLIPSMAVFKIFLYL